MIPLFLSITYQKGIGNAYFDIVFAQNDIVLTASSGNR